MGSVFHEMTDEELDKQLVAARSELRELRFNYAVVRSLQDPARVGKLRRNVARILTVRKERGLGITGIKPKTDRRKGKGAAKSKPALESVKEKLTRTPEKEKPEAGASAVSEKSVAVETDTKKAGETKKTETKKKVDKKKTEAKKKS